MRPNAALRVHFSDGNVHGVLLDEPAWFQAAARNWPATFCMAAMCRQYLELPCRTCKSTRTGRFVSPVDRKPFYHAIWALTAWGLPKDLARLVVRRYAVLGAQRVGLVCPYVRIKVTDNPRLHVFHLHCIDHGGHFDMHSEDVYAYGRAEVALHFPILI